jgi:hypothetical protein
VKCRHRTLVPSLFLFLVSTVTSSAEPQDVGLAHQLVLFDYQNAGAVARGTVRFIEGNDPSDGIGVYGGAMEVEFIPAVVFKGGMEPIKRYRVDIPNRFLSYQATYISRDHAYVQRQELLQERLDSFSAEFSRGTEAYAQGEMGEEEYQRFSEIADIVAREVSGRKLPVTIHSSPAKPLEQTPIQKIVFDGNMYTLLLMPPSSGGNGKYTLSTRDRSIFGGLENFYVQRVIENDSIGQ